MKRIVLRLSDEALVQLAALALATRMSVSENIRLAIDARLVAHGLPAVCQPETDRLVIMCTCDHWETCAHPWPALVSR